MKSRILAGLLVLILTLCGSGCHFPEPEAVKQMPNLTRLPYDEVKSAYKYQFELVIAGEEYSEDYPEGTIISQSIEAGADYAVGTAVQQVIVSKGEPPLESQTETIDEVTKTHTVTTTTLPEIIANNPFKDIGFTADYRNASNAVQKYTEHFYYTVDGVTVYTESDYRSLYAKIVDSDDTPTFIDEYASNIIFANGEITYTDHGEIKIYDLKTEKIKLDFDDWGYAINCLARNSDKIAYNQTAILAGHETMTSLSVLDLNTMEIERIYHGFFLNVLEEGVIYDFDEDDQTVLHNSFNFDMDGNLYYAVLSDDKEDGFHKFTIYKHNFEINKAEEVLIETSEIPFTTFFSESVFISETDGMYYINQNGELIKL
jgi:hypothetical protein